MMMMMMMMTVTMVMMVSKSAENIQTCWNQDWLICYCNVPQVRSALSV